MGSVPTRGIGTPTAGKSASLTFRLVLRASQPITMSNKVENTRRSARLGGFVVAPWRCPVEWKNVIIFENLQGKARFEA